MSNPEATVNLKILVGIFVSLVLFWLSARNVDLGEAWRHAQSINAWYFVPYMALIAGEVLIRAWKWQVLLAPIKRCSFLKLTSATLIGLFANNVLPARAGEFVRAYAGAKMERIPYSTSFATVVVDRLLDGLTVSAIFVLTLIFQPLPEEIKAAGYLAGLIYLASLVVLVGLIVREQATLHVITVLIRPFPHQIGDFVMRTVRAFVEGLGVFRSGRLLLTATTISMLIWAGYALSLYLTFLAFSIDLGIAHAFVVLLILTIVLTLPSSPGFVGAMEWAITFGLGLFGVNADQAFAVAIVYHVSQYVPITVGGFIALVLARLSVGEIAHVQGPPPDGPGLPRSSDGELGPPDQERTELHPPEPPNRQSAAGIAPALRSDTP